VNDTEVLPHHLVCRACWNLIAGLERIAVIMVAAVKGQQHAVAASRRPAEHRLFVAGGM
jgi:hypothetical protein